MERVLDVGGVRTPCQVDGSGPPLVLLHGLGASTYSWRRVWEPLAAKRTVVRFDWPGHGKADQPVDFDYSIRGYSSFLVGALDALGLKSPDVAGNSLGGVVTLL